MNFKKLVGCVSLALAVSTVIRILQVVFCVEYDTGFYIMGKAFLGGFCLVLLALICGALVFITFKTEKIAVTLHESDVLLATMSAFVAVALFIELFGENMPMTMPANQVLLLKMATAFTAVYFIVFALRHIIRFKMSPILHIVPTAYAIIKTIFTFINFSSLALISDNILLLASYSSLMLFFISYGRLYNGILEKKGSKKIFAIGFVTAVITLTSSLPNMIINIFGKKPYLHTDTDILITLFALGVFAIVFTLKLANKKEHI